MFNFEIPKTRSPKNEVQNACRIPTRRGSTLRNSLLLSTLGAALVVSPACYADSLAAPIFTLQATAATTLFTGGTLTSSTTNVVFEGGTQTSTATAAFGIGDASVSANGSTVGGINTALSSANAVVIFYVEAVQTGSTPMPVTGVPLIFSGSVTTNASGAEAAASASFETPGGSIDACSSSTGACGSPGANSGSVSYTASVGEIYDIEVQASGGSGYGSGTWFASADPEVVIDPSFALAKDFTLEFSAGGTSGGGGTTPPPPPGVPEPASLALLSVALSALLGLTATCKRLCS